MTSVADPVDTITGAFYVDELDLELPGHFPLEIRRNYNSQNPVHGNLGAGWKLSLNPFLVKQKGKLFAAEADGSVICYSYNSLNSRYEVDPDDNPDLYNFNQKGIGGNASLFHSYIQNNVLYGADGSKRFFEEGLLKRWVNHKGITLTFHYDDENLSRIESSNGDSLGFHYNHQGYISEIYAKDGRPISYDYNSQGNLVKVTLPNTANIIYEYDRHHRIIRETKPHGQILENIYDNEGRVKEQRSPAGPDQVMVTTATFAYTEGVTTATDGMQGKTNYKIYDKQIYKVIDPVGSVIFQSWFVTEDSWFDAETEQILPWEESGAFPKSLKSTTDKRGLTTTYLYDQRENPIQIELKGKDLTGGGHTRVFKKLAYNENNLCTEEATCGQTVHTIYDDTFPYQPKRIEKYHKKNLISYIDFDYNTQGLVTREDRNGSITFWHYNSRNLPDQKVQKTGTEDPDYTTTYSYNYQGRCTKTESPDAIEENAYDIMGNLIQSEVFSPSGKLLSATYIGYNQNNQPIWKQTANPDNTLHLDYNSSGLLKASWQTLTPSNKKAYHLYEYDPRGFLTQEVDPLGICTIRDYDALGNISCETIEGHSTQYTYEAGGLVKTMTSPSGATTTRHYTTNGLLKEEIYPDGTKTTIVYDFFGRPIQETKNGITWEMTYDDSNHQITCIHVETGISETKEFDANGNLIRIIDGAGYAIEKTYDGLGRIKTETMLSGKQTTWNYQNDTTTTPLSSGEQVIDRYEGGKVAESKTFDPCGNLIATSSYAYDPENDIQIIRQGEVTTTTWMNTFGLPIKVQKGTVITTYEYDKCGNCTAIIDGEGYMTRQTFDRLHRITQKEFPDGSLLAFDYDLDSNLIEYHLPNGNIWEASYDSMKRKTSEKIQAGRETAQEWNYSYEEGHLKEIIDPMGRSRRYTYDSHGRLAQETTYGWERAYTYDPRGFLLSAEQIGSQSLSWVSSWFYTPREEHSIVERSYDADGHLTYESIYLNSKQIQETHQEWGPSYRTLQIEDHKRTLVYQNNQLTQLSTKNLELAYTYYLSGALKDKLTPLYSSRVTYNPSGLPETIISGGFQESLDWTPSGKLSTYHSPSKQKHFTYTPLGHLKSAGEEHYTFDFEKEGTGVRTAAPYAQVSKLDPFGKVTLETIGKDRLTTDYNPMGQVTSQGGKTFEWDPWGRLLTVSNETFTWEASYDALGRRLQTRYTTQGSETLKATSLYDPEKEFQEIGIQIGNKTFWKLYGPSSCDAILDETGASAFLLHNALSELVAVITQQNTHYTPNVCSAYGPQLPPHISYDLLSYAQSLTWQSKSQDPTGLIWMGERYYDPRGGRFLSPDPIRHPLCMDLYAYAGGDPVNYFDPSGRFASQIYQVTKPPMIHMVNAFSSVCANYDLTRSSNYEVGSFELSNGALLFINGIDNKRYESMESASRISQYAQGAKVYGIYNATNSQGIDILECIAGRIGMHTLPVQHLKNTWNHLIATHGPGAKFLQNCHSGGAEHVKNALLTSSESVRQKIIVLALNPSVIVPKRLCYESYNYMSRRDFVTRLDIMGKLKYGNELHILEPHPDAKYWDHEFASPTFERKIQEHIADYVKTYGGIE